MKHSQRAGRLAGQVAVITGSTKGLGRVMAKIFADEGASVVISGRDVKAGNEVVKWIEAGGGTAMFARADVSVEADLQALMQAAADKYKKIDILVNNAMPIDFEGAGGDGPVDTLVTENWDYMMKAGIYGPFWAAKYAIPHIRKAGGGSVINISSMQAKVGIRHTSSMCAAKSALNGLTRQMAVDYAPDNIRVNVIIIGFVLSGAVAHMLAENPATAAGIEAMSMLRMGKSEDVGYAALFLASNEAEFITGIELPVDGGNLARASTPDFQSGMGNAQITEGGVAPKVKYRAQ